jgi:hypothetical protein
VAGVQSQHRFFLGAKTNTLELGSLLRDPIVMGSPVGESAFPCVVTRFLRVVSLLRGSLYCQTYQQEGASDVHRDTQVLRHPRNGW